MITKHTLIIAAAIILGLSAAVGAQTAVGYYTRYREQAAASVPTPPSSAWQNVYIDSTTHALMRKDSSGTSTAISGGGTVIADSPLGGDGSSGSHLTCSLCVTTTGSQTLTNKTLTSPVINGATSASGNFDLSGSSGTWKPPTGGLAATLVGANATNLTLQAASGQHIILSIGAGNYARITSTAIRPENDSQIEFGEASLRFKTGYVGISGALPTCDSTSRGGFRTVFAAGGASDTFQVCMKAAADTYAWRTVYTAP